MMKACSKCGKIHPYNYECKVGRIFAGGDERKLRSSYAWTKKSEEIREQANYLCEVCRDEGIYTYDGIEVHHITKVRDDKSLLLDNNNLICLCKKHHLLADDNLIDKEYLITLAKRRGEGK
jgi:5-methylcytosine-specific restriction endonuclease McrA